MSNCHVCNCKLVSSILSTLSLPRHSAPTSDPPQCSDALCGSCPPSSGSAAQTNSLWPSLPQSSGGFPAWPGQAVQTVQAPPCWTGQPNTPCWTGTQPPSYTIPVSMPPITTPTQTMAPVPAPAPVVVPAPAPVPAPVPSPAPAPAPVQPCQTYWPGSQCQPAQPPAPIQTQVPAPVQAPTPIPVPVPAAAPVTGIHPSISVWPSHPGWAYNPGQSGWPGQHPSIMTPHWLPPTSGPLVRKRVKHSARSMANCFLFLFI